jgi:D-psicose/D-tagatose/L-ribulose 3-epimerase
MRNPLGVHALVFTGGTSPDQVRQAVDQAAAAGYDLLELALLDPGSVDIGAARAAVEGAGIAVTGSLGLAPATDVSSEDPGAVAAGERLLLSALDVVSGLGGRHLCGVLYSAMGKYLAPATPRGRANSVAVIQRLADRAADKGVRLALEVVNRYETNLLNTAAEALAFVDEVDRPNVGVHLDTYHMNIEENTMDLPVLAAAGRLGYVHIGESHRGYLGSGSVDFGPFFRALAQVGYDGPVTFESFSSAVVDRVLSNQLGVWRNLWDDSDHLARHARAFMDTGLESGARAAGAAAA